MKKTILISAALVGLLFLLGADFTDKGPVKNPFAALWAELHKLEIQTNGMLSDINDQQSQINAITPYLDDINDLKDQIPGLLSEVNDLQLQLNGITPYLQDINGLKTQMAGLSGQVNGLQSQINAITSSMSSNSASLKDAFLWVEGIPGESTEQHHKDWIEIQDSNWGVSPLGSRLSEWGHDLVIVHKLDKSSPKLAEACVNNSPKGARTVMLELNRRSPEREILLPYMKYTLSNAQIVSVTTKGDMEQVIFSGYDKIECVYTQYDENGSPKGTIKVNLP